MEFEKKLKLLEETSEMLDDKDLPLESAIALFENGVKLIHECLDGLQESKGRIDVIRGELENILHTADGGNAD